MDAHWHYFKYVWRHKWHVFWACLEVGVPIWSALLHDWDKFMPDEWFAYVERYGNNNDFHKALESPAYQMAWHKHQRRNKHHWQNWCTPKEDGTLNLLPMPDRARREMLADWMGFGRAIGQPRFWEWYDRYRHRMQLHPETRAWVEVQVERARHKYEPQMPQREVT